MMATKEEVTTEAVNELWGVAECYKDSPQELLSAMASVMAHFAKRNQVTHGQLIHLISDSWEQVK